MYVRDKRSPTPSSKVASKVMSSIGAKNTKPERLLRKYLWERKLRGYRLHWKIEGKPDISFVKHKIAIFVHGCFWHRCPHCNLPMPKSNSDFWKEKFERNVDRDKRKELVLKKTGWKVLTFWECKIAENPKPYLDKVTFYVEKQDNL